MCLYIVDNVSTCRIIYFRYVDTEKRNNLNAIFEYRVGHFGTRDSNFSGKTRIPGSRAQPYLILKILDPHPFSNLCFLHPLLVPW